MSETYATHYQVRADLPENRVFVFGVEAPGPRTAEAKARRIFAAVRPELNRAAKLTVTEEVPVYARPKPDHGVGDYGLRLFSQRGDRVQDRYYVRPGSAASAAGTYSRKGYRVEFFDGAQREEVSA